LPCTSSIPPFVSSLNIPDQLLVSASGQLAYWQ